MVSPLNVDTLHAQGCLAILRANSTEHFATTVQTLVESGLRTMEFSLTTPGALSTFATVAANLPADVHLGIGTVTTVREAHLAADAGAHFLVSPTVNLAVIEYACVTELPILVGALTPTEVITAWNAGATAVKLFPASIGGPTYCKDLHSGPFPAIPLVPTGGIRIGEVPDYFAAGAAAVGMATPLLGSALSGGSQAELATRVHELRTALGGASSAGDAHTRRVPASSCSVREKS